MPRSTIIRFARTAFIRTMTMAVAAECFFANPIVETPAIAASASAFASEAEEWGLEEPKVPAKPEPSKQFPRSQPRREPTSTKQPAAIDTPAVPAELAEPISQSSVLILLMMEDGKELCTLGWIVDRERRIIMTHGHLVTTAKKIFVGYPQIPRGGKDGMAGSPAILMKGNTEFDIAYLQVENPIPESLPTLQVAASDPAPVNHQQARDISAQRPVQSNNPFVGQWFLQDVVNGYRVSMQAKFLADGRFQVHSTMVDQFGNQESELLYGTYQLQGDKLLLQTNEGPQQSKFAFEDGLLYVKLDGSDVTFCFQRG